MIGCWGGGGGGGNKKYLEPIAAQNPKRVSCCLRDKPYFDYNIQHPGWQKKENTISSLKLKLS